MTLTAEIYDSAFLFKSFVNKRLILLCSGLYLLSESNVCIISERKTEKKTENEEFVDFCEDAKNAKKSRISKTRIITIQNTRSVYSTVVRTESLVAGVK